LTARSATEALQRLGQDDVDLLLTDYRMPGPSGVELIESARRMKPELRAILMTSFGDTFTEIESVRGGAIGYVNKPFEADEITNLVGRIPPLRGTRTRRSRRHCARPYRTKTRHGCTCG